MHHTDVRTPTGPFASAADLLSLSIVASVAVASLATVTVTAETFEVASVKENKSGPVGARFVVQPGGRVTITNVNLREIIRVAYQVQDHQIVDGPEWIRATRFDILAKSAIELPPLPPPPSFNAPSHPLFPLLRSLLAERFRLVVHKEQRDIPIYALVLARSDGRLGRQLTRSSTDCTAVTAAKDTRGQASSATAGAESGGAATCRMVGSVGHISADSQPLSQLVQVLAGWSNRFVVDRTNLAGLFNFSLDFTPDQMLQPGGDIAPAVAPTDSERPILFTAVQEQLGLRLMPTKERLDVVSIREVQMPTPD